MPLRFTDIPLLLAEFSVISLVPLAGVMLIVTGLMMMIRKRRRQQHGSSLSPPEQIERNRQLRGMRGDLEDLMVEIEQAAKRLAAQLDAKAVQMDMLLKEADQRIAELRRLSAAGGAATAGSTASRPAPPAAESAEPAEPADPLAKAVYRLADDGVAPPDIARRLNEHVGKIELILALRAT